MRHPPSLRSPKVADLTEAQYNRLLNMLLIKRPRSSDEVETFDRELRERSSCGEQDGESRRAIGAALSEEEWLPTMLGSRRWDWDEEAGELSEHQMQMDAQAGAPPPLSPPLARPTAASPHGRGVHDDRPVSIPRHLLLTARPASTLP